MGSELTRESASLDTRTRLDGALRRPARQSDLFSRSSLLTRVSRARTHTREFFSNNSHDSKRAFGCAVRKRGLIVEGKIEGIWSEADDG